MTFNGWIAPIKYDYRSDLDMWYRYQLDWTDNFDRMVRWPYIVSVEELETQLYYWSDYLEHDVDHTDAAQDLKALRHILKLRRSPVWNLLHENL